MIVVKLMGGLGNQLFQYAAGRALAVKYNTELKVDTSFLNAPDETEHTRRKIELQHFYTNYTEATTNDIRPFVKPSFFKKVLNKYFPFHSSNFYYAKEKGFEFNKDFEVFPPNTYLEGFWQTEKYFGSIRSLLLDELRLKMEMTKEVALISERILKSNSVSVHIRRGDYVTNKKASEFHGNLGLDYYSQGLSLITKKTESPVVFVFSDDMEWVKTNYKNSYETIFVDFNKGENSVWDLYLMSLCKHNIIANSSFSWWAAWLNRYPEKIVVAPKHWFANKTMNTKDLLPVNWLKI